MAWSFRLRLAPSPRNQLDIDKETLILSRRDDSLITVRLAAATLESTIKCAPLLAIVGDGFESEAEASEAGERWRAQMMAVFAAMKFGADFGERAPKGGFTPIGLASLAQSTGRRVLNDRPGVVTYETDPKPTFVSSSANLTVGKSEQQFIDTLNNAAQLDYRLDKAQRLAYELLSASFFSPYADTRFLLLMMSIETLLDPQPRSTEAIEHVSTLVESTRESALSATDKESIASVLDGLKKESIGAAGRKLARTLEPDQYMSMTPSRFFSHCYTLRSRLVHGARPRPSRDDIDTAAASLETFVANLLAGPLGDMTRSNETSSATVISSSRQDDQ